MKPIFEILSFLFLTIIVICNYFLLKNKTQLSKKLFTVNSMGFTTALFYQLSLLNINYNLAITFSAAYYSCVHISLFVLLSFLFVFTETSMESKSIKLFKRIWTVLLVLDVTSLLLNVFFLHEFVIFPIIKNGQFAGWSTTYKWVFHIHLILSYILVIIIFYGLIAISIKSNRFYRYKYVTILSILFIVVVVNAISLFSGLPVDISVLMYCIFSISASYFCIYSVPKRVETTMLQLVADNINSGVFCFDSSKTCIYSNKTSKNMFQSAAEVYDELESLLKLGQNSVIRNITVIKDSKKNTYAEEFQIITDSAGKPSGYFIHLTDITEGLQALDEEQYRSTHDSLTGLFNRENFFLEAEKCIRSDPTTPRYLVSTNIKNFKLINDLFGSSFADKLLIQQAVLLTKAPHTGTIFGRISSDKFAMLIEKKNFNPELAIKNTELLQDFTSSFNYKLHVFIGVYEISDPYEKVNTMYDKANLAIRSIRDNYAINLAYYSADLLSHVIEETNLVTNFEGALTDNQFQMYLQPQVRCSDGKVLGGEALVRWHHPGKGLLTPGSFVNALENTGYLYKLDLFIWEKAAETLSLWKKQNIDTYIAVNISPKDFYHLDIYKIFTGLVQKYEIDPAKLKLEITENALIYDLKLHCSILKKLQKAGFQIEMDDFGSGYSSLNMLKNVNVDILKIDMAFIRLTNNIQRGQIILKSIINMAKKLGMAVIMEGVEESAQAEYLQDMGCDIFQGYFYSRPISLELFTERYLTEE